MLNILYLIRISFKTKKIYTNWYEQMSLGKLNYPFVGYLCGKCMSTSRVDERHRIVIDKHTRSITKIKAGDIVIIEPLDDRSFKVKALVS